MCWSLCHWCSTGVASFIFVITSELAAQHSSAWRLLRECLSIHLLHSWVAPKWFKLLKYFSHRTIEWCFEFAEAKYCSHHIGGSPQIDNLLLTAKICPIIRTNLEIECKWILFSSRKWHTGYRLAPKLVTLNVLQLCNGHYFALSYQIQQLFGPITSTKM